MATKWTEINESLMSNRNASAHTDFNMDEMEAEMAISEALAVAAEGKYIAGEILEGFFDFNKKAEDRGFSAVEYISEAFSIGGFFKKIIDILAKFWGVIVNFFKALFGKVGGTNGTLKTLKDLKAEISALEARSFKEVDGKGDTKKAASIKFKEYELEEAATVALSLLDAKSYLDFDLKDGATLVKITETAVNVANSVKTDDDGNKPKGKSEDLSKTEANIKESSEGLEALIKEVGFGDKGAGTILLKFFAAQPQIKAIVDKKDSKLKEAKKVSEILKQLSQSFFAKDAEVQTVEAKARLTSLKGIVDLLLAGSKTSTTSTVRVSLEALERNGFEEARKQAQDILDKLKEAAKKIGSVKGTSFDTKEKGEDVAAAQKDNEDAAGKVATAMGKLSTNLLEVQSSMQAVITGGMDNGAALLKAVTNEVSNQVKAIGKLSGDFKRKAGGDEE